MSKGSLAYHGPLDNTAKRELLAIQAEKEGVLKVERR